jgi:serine/threonine protein kinase
MAYFFFSFLLRVSVDLRILIIHNSLFSDVWAIGVITYFLLCGYTPFDRDSHVEEMQAILAADYKFEPKDYWENVSETGIYHTHTITPPFFP